MHCQRVSPGQLRWCDVWRHGVWRVNIFKYYRIYFCFEQKIAGEKKILSILLHLELSFARNGFFSINNHSILCKNIPPWPAEWELGSRGDHWCLSWAQSSGHITSEHRTPGDSGIPECQGTKVPVTPASRNWHASINITVIQSHITVPVQHTMLGT